MREVGLGSFGWATHNPRGPGREVKRRACVVIMEHAGRLICVFGRTEANLRKRQEAVAADSALGRKLGLHHLTYFEAEVHLLPADFDPRGQLAVLQGDAGDEDTVVDDDLWLRLRALGSPEH